MNRFLIYLELGYDHILSWNGQDHLLFLLALCAFYRFNQLKDIFWLVTAFTVGHCVSLLISTFYVIPVSSDLLEMLIPITILLTCFYNLFFSEWNAWYDKEGHQKWTKPISHYLLTLVFGMIHGIGFANYFSMISTKGESIVRPLFAFNIGVEMGQLVFVVGILFFYWLLDKQFSIAHKYWNLGMSALAAILAVRLIFELG